MTLEGVLRILIPPQLICPCHCEDQRGSCSLHPMDGGLWVGVQPQFVENEYAAGALSAKSLQKLADSWHTCPECLTAFLIPLDSSGRTPTRPLADPTGPCGAC